jgi:predicted HicB family RNase H-like nuclease
MTNNKVKTFPLRLPRSTQIEAGEIAAREGISLNQFIALAVAEKITRMGLMQPDTITGRTST